MIPNNEKLYRVQPNQRLDYIVEKINQTLSHYNYDANDHEIYSYCITIGVVDRNGLEQTIALSDGLLNTEHLVDYHSWLGVLQVANSGR